MAILLFCTIMLQTIAGKKKYISKATLFSILRVRPQVHVLDQGVKGSGDDQPSPNILTLSCWLRHITGTTQSKAFFLLLLFQRRAAIQRIGVKRIGNSL